MKQSPRNQLIHGTLETIVLKVLAGGPRHGYGITRFIQQNTGDALAVEEGSIYPALYRMERKGWIEAEWGLSPETKRDVKFYTLTPAGRKQLRVELEEWKQFAAAVGKLLHA